MTLAVPGLMHGPQGQHPGEALALPRRIGDCAYLLLFCTSVDQLRLVGAKPSKPCKSVLQPSATLRICSSCIICLWTL